MSEFFDVVVVGGGPSGIGAAIGAAKSGASVVLLERHSALGGMGTSALVNNFCPAHWDGRRLIIGGVFGRIRQRLIESQAIFSHQVVGQHPGMEVYDPAAFETTAMDLCEEAGVRVHLGVSIENQDINDRGGLFRTSIGPIQAATVVDCTGDATIAYRAGVPCEFKRGGVMPLSYCFAFGPIDVGTLQREMPEAVGTDPITGKRRIYFSSEETGRVGELFARARSNGDFTIPRKGLPLIASLPSDPTVATVNLTRVFCQDPTDPVELAKATAEGQRQVYEAVAWFRNYWPGMDRVELQNMARQIGVRESRQIRGRYTIDRDDVIGCRQFHDVVCQCWYPIDVHHPDGDGTTLINLEIGTHYDIPLRCLLPEAGPSCVIVGGRSISATQEAMSSFRVSPSVMAIGEAAGVTASLAAQRGVSVSEVEYSCVRRCLLSNGAILE